MGLLQRIHVKLQILHCFLTLILLIFYVLKVWSAFHICCIYSITHQKTYHKIDLLRNFTLVKLKTIKFEPVHEISNNAVCVTSKASDQPAHMRGLIRAIARCFEYSIIVKLLIEHHLQFQSLKGGCGGSSGSAVVEVSNC